MPTKIINILKDDRFEDILEIFKRAPAGDIIFVLPKRANVLSTEGHFAAIAEAAELQRKNILILTSNPAINELALKFNFGLLTSEKKTVAASKKNNETPEPETEPALKPEPEKETDTVDEIEIEDTNLSAKEPDFENTEDKATTSGQEEGAGVYQGFENESYKAQLIAAAAVAKRNKPTPDTEIIEEDKTKIKIFKRPERSPKLDLKKENISPLNQRALDEIQNVWKFRSRKSADQETKKSFIDPMKVFAPSRINKPPLLNLHGKVLVMLGFVVVIILGIAIYITAGSANITIKPKVHSLDSVLKVSVSDQFQSIDVESKNIPGQFFSVDKKIEESFPATGEKDVVQKARGKITVYNEYGTTPQALIATTRFESQEGLIFRTLKTITVPGTKVQNGKIIPGTIEVEVIADKAGDSYNIGSGKFTIPAFKERGDLDRFDKFYGISEESMKGGIIGKAKVVTEQDFVSAKKAIEEKLIKETEQDLKNQTSGLKILTPFQPTIEEINSSAQIDEATDVFTVAGIGEFQTIGFKESDLNNFIIGYIEKMNNLLVFPEKLNINFKDLKFHTDKKTLEFGVAITGPAYSKVDNQKVLSELYGKDEAKIKEYIKSIEAISSAKVVLSPFWVKKVPANPNKVKIEIVY